MANEAPKGVKERKNKGAFGNRFKSTVMGTAVFVAEMQRKVPLRTKLLFGLLILLGGGLGVWAYLDYRATAEAREELTAALEVPPDVGASRVRSILSEGHLGADSRAAAITYLGKAEDAQSVPLLLEALDGPEEAVRAAAQALARIGAPAALAARDKLVARLTDAEPTEVVPMAWALASMGDERGLEISVEGLASGSLQELPSYEPARLAKQLGPDGLVERLAHPHVAVRQFAARWLGSHCAPEVVQPLVATTNDDETSVAAAAAVSLVRCDPRLARETVPSVLRRSPSLRAPLTSAFANEVGAPGLGILLLSANDLSDRARIVQQLTKLHDPRSGDELMQEYERTAEDERKHRLELGKALADIGDPRTPIVLEPFLEMDEGWAQVAIEALGNSGLGDEIAPQLLALYDDRRGLRAVVLRAMGHAGVCIEEARATMTRAARRSELAAAAIEALGRCGDSEAADLAMRALNRYGRTGAGKTTTEEGQTRLSAYDALARVGHTQASELLLETVLDADDDPRSRTGAAHALGIVGDPATLERAVDAAMARGTSPRVRDDLFLALRHDVPRPAIARLMGRIRGGEDTERTLGAAAILGEAARASLQGELVELLSDERARRIAALVVVRGGNEEGLRKLVKLTAGDEALDSFVRRHALALPLVLAVEDLDSGAFYRRLAHLATLRDLGVGAFWDDYVRSLEEGSTHPGGLRGIEIRRRLAADLREGSDRQRRLAGEALAELGARGVLLAVRAEGGAGAKEAIAALR